MAGTKTFLDCGQLRLFLVEWKSYLFVISRKICHNKQRIYLLGPISAIGAFLENKWNTKTWVSFDPPISVYLCKLLIIKLSIFINVFRQIICLIVISSKGQPAPFILIQTSLDNDTCSRKKGVFFIFFRTKVIVWRKLTFFNY